MASPYQMNKKHFMMMVFVIFGLISIFGCGGGGGGGDDGGDDPIVCNAPFVPNSAGTACVCPSGTHQDGNTCVADTTPDTTPPTVFVTAPANNATVSGNLSVTASAVDNRGIAEVNLVVDGSQTGNTFTENPANVFTTSLNTTALANGSHTLKVCAIDTSTNTSCSSEVTVVVTADNTLKAPTVQIQEVPCAIPATGFRAVKVTWQENSGSWNALFNLHSVDIDPYSDYYGIWMINGFNVIEYTSNCIIPIGSVRALVQSCVSHGTSGPPTCTPSGYSPPLYIAP